MPSPSVEETIKQQFAKFFTQDDAEVFKLVAEYYLRKATFLRKKDIDIDQAYRLLLRNIQKRLFIGVGCELLLKAYFLHNRYCINFPNKNDMQPGKAPYLIDTIQKENFKVDKTFSFDQLIGQLQRTIPFMACTLEDKGKIRKAFQIAKVFRNKEGHVATLWHKPDAMSYSDLEKGLEIFYEMAFSKKLQIRFSFEQNEKGQFKIKNV